MLKSQVQIGGRYTCKVANQLTTVRITGENRYGGWNAVNEKTKRDVRIKSAAKLRGPAEPIKTTANGERMMTGNQQALIEKLLNEKVIDGALLARYEAAVLEGKVTLEAASMFIKHLIKAPRRDSLLPSELHEAVRQSEQEEMTDTERLSLILDLIEEEADGNEAIIDLLKEASEILDSLQS